MILALFKRCRHSIFSVVAHSFGQWCIIKQTYEFLLPGGPWTNEPHCVPRPSPNCHAWFCWTVLFTYRLSLLAICYSIQAICYWLELCKLSWIHSICYNRESLHGLFKESKYCDSLCWNVKSLESRNRIESNYEKIWSKEFQIGYLMGF